jgi:hypothetical protein
MGRSGDGSVIATLTGLSYRDTSRGRRYPYGEFGQNFIEALHSALPGFRRTGLLRQGRACASCGSSFDGIPVGTVAAAVDVVMKRIPPIHVDVEMPGITCPSCGRAATMISDRGVQSDLSDALIAIFDEAQISPG